MRLDAFTRAEREQIALAVKNGVECPCPRCGGHFKLSAVPPDPAVAYVRRRVLAVCTGCHRSVAVDLPRGVR